MGGQCQHLQIEALRLKLAQWEKDPGWRRAFENSPSRESASGVSSGCPALDRILPENGFRAGTLVEWLSYGPGDGAATLAFRAVACALRAAGAGSRHPLAGREGDGRAVVVVDAGGEFYPPAAVALGIEPSRLIVVHPNNRADHTWALDQALRCPAVAAAVAWTESVHVASVGHAERSESHRNIGGTRCAGPPYNVTANSMAAPFAACNWPPSRGADWAC